MCACAYLGLAWIAESGRVRAMGQGRLGRVAETPARRGPAWAGDGRERGKGGV